MESYDLALLGILLAVIILALQLLIQGQIWINTAESKKASKQVVFLGIFFGIFGIGTLLAISIFTRSDWWRICVTYIALFIGLIVAIITLRLPKWEKTPPINAVAANAVAEPAAPARTAAPDQQSTPATVNIIIPPSRDKTISITLTIT